LKVVLTKGRKVTEADFSGEILRWIESLLDLPITIAILPESDPKEIQLIV
jgi:hypothetical protein